MDKWEVRLRILPISFMLMYYFEMLFCLSQKWLNIVLAEHYCTQVTEVGQTPCSMAITEQRIPEAFAYCQ